MGFFSGIGKALGSVVGAISDPLSSVMNIASPFMEQRSASQANAGNLQAARENIAFQREQADIGRDFALDQQRRATNFSREMAGTTYRRGVRDMRAAGLNPMLAVSQGGAPSPSGSAVSGPGVPSGAMPNLRPTFSAQSVASAAQAMQLHQQAKQTSAQVSNVEADTANKLAEAGRIQADTWLKRQQAATESYRPGEVTAKTRENIARSRQLEETLFDTIDKIRSEVISNRESASQMKSQRVLMKELQSNPNTKGWAPYLYDILRK